MVKCIVNAILLDEVEAFDIIILCAHAWLQRLLQMRSLRHSFGLYASIMCGVERAVNHYRHTK